ncbi:MAG TPA: chitobiase/beta-hexosaminidase C-terminal domain-containing protein, partial [Polyangiaceae bacterium]|nr:chitobiase/beta-hexosaminidase C-terminal domain-containing protein [Polyangiaceae bacterium]
MLRRTGLLLLNVWLVSACGNEGGVGEPPSPSEDAASEVDAADDDMTPGEDEPGDSESGSEDPEGDGSTGGAPSDGGTRGDAGPRSDAGGSVSGPSDGGCWRLPAVDRVRIRPAPGKRSAVLQGTIQGSTTSATNGFVELAQVMELSAGDDWIELHIAQPSAYRYVKYYGPSGSYGALAELELYAGNARLSGKGFGSAGPPGDTEAYARALDGDLTSAFQGALPDDNYVGLDLAADHLLAPPQFSPGAGSYPSATSVQISAAQGAQIFYTRDGRDPNEAGVALTGPIEVGMGGTLLRAVARRACMQTSEIAQAIYQVGAGPSTVQSSMHIGNSLTDTIVEDLQPLAQSGGITLDFNRYTVPGAGSWVYVLNPAGGFGVPNVQEAMRTRRFDHVSMQPYPNMPCQVTASADGNDSDSLYLNMVWGDARSQNPNVQFWVYHQWPAPVEYSNCLSGGGWLRSDWKPPAPKNWEEAVKNELGYQEAVRAELIRLNPNVPPPYIVPAGLALIALKREIEAGRAPGLT